MIHIKECQKANTNLHLFSAHARKYLGMGFNYDGYIDESPEAYEFLTRAGLDISCFKMWSLDDHNDRKFVSEEMVRLI